MKEQRKRSYVNRRLKYITKEEYDYNDILNLDNKFGERKIPYLHTVLRKRLTHIDTVKYRDSKPYMMKSMGIKIFFMWVSVIVEELFKGNTLQIKNVGTIRLGTRQSTSTYSGYRDDRKRSKNKGFYTAIDCQYEDKLRRMRYRYPFWALGKYYSNKVRRLEDAGIKF